MKRETILVVEDMEINRMMLRELFCEEHDILEAVNGVQAMDIILRDPDKIGLILLDIIMPEKNGLEVLQDMQREGLIGRIPVIIITAADSVESQIKAMEYGASDLILKPFEPKLVMSRVENVLNAYQYKKQMEATIHVQRQLINKSYMAMIDTLKMIVVHRNMESGQHIQRIQRYTKILLSEVAQQNPQYNISQDYINLVAKASMLHDVGKIVMPDNILNKPGRLTLDEFEVMKTHSVEGCNILNGINQVGNRKFLQCAYDICRHHHERWNGKGYPDGLKGDEISLSAQVVGVADAYDALVNRRIYKPAYTHEQAVTMILNGACGCFSPKLMKSFENVAPKFKATLEKYAGDDNEENGEEIILNNLVDFLSEGESELPLQGDSYRYYALLQYLNASVFEVDIKTGKYKQVYPTTIEFNQLKPEGIFKEDLFGYLRSNSFQEIREELLEWLQESFIKLEEHEVSCIKKKYQFFNKKHQDCMWFELSFVSIEGDFEDYGRFLFILKQV